ncbi:Protein NETWORKED 3A isoform C [Glycine soja]|uniref:Protein NETWORKED 3A isoform C n=1 Tax=Glycine soja TaxID=3848 RepID=A0A445LEW4_GLYSO|nr:Protein NETWORKED 3A isoform C [Glycine soja]
MFETPPRGSQLTWDLVGQGVLGLVDLVGVLGLVDLVGVLVVEDLAGQDGVLGLVGQAGVQAWVDLASLGLADLASLGLMGFLVDVQMVYAALYLHASTACAVVGFSEIVLVVQAWHLLSDNRNIITVIIINLD